MGMGGLSQDYFEARKYFESSARTGLIPEAYEVLGIFDSYGLGTKSQKPNMMKAKNNFLLAQTPNSLLMLGDLYQNGDFDEVELHQKAEQAIRQSFSIEDESYKSALEDKTAELANTEAWRYYEIANGMGHAPAAGALGMMALHGFIPKSYLDKDKSKHDRSDNKKSSHSRMPLAKLKAKIRGDAKYMAEDRSASEEDYHIAWDFFQRGLNLLSSQNGTDGRLANITYDQNKLDLYYYAGLMRAYGLGPEPENMCEAASLLAHAARHTLWLQNDSPSSFHQLLQEALISYESLSTSTALISVESNEALRRYEVLALLGDPLSQMNCGFLYMNLARTTYSSWQWLRRWPFSLIFSVIDLKRDTEQRKKFLRYAKVYYEMASVQGAAEAQRELGHCLWGVEAWEDTCQTEGSTDKRAKEARRLFETAAFGDAHDIQAIRALGHMAGVGEVGYPADRQESRQLYRTCARLGGYPDGLPCQFESFAMEIRWVLSDLFMLLMGMCPSYKYFIF